MASYDFFRHFSECNGDAALIGKMDAVTAPDTEEERSGYRGRKPLGKRGTLAKRAVVDLSADRRSAARSKDVMSREKLSICATLPFLGAGTMVKTRNGEVPADSLDKSDQVLTRDHGFQPIFWVGQTEIPARYFRENPNACPIVIPAGSLGANFPERPLCVANSHRILLRSQAAELAFLSSEVFAEASVWVQLGQAERVQPKVPLTVFHVLLASHELIMADGVWVESILAVPEMLRLLDPAGKAELEKSLGPEIYTQQTARTCVTRKEALMLLKQDPAYADTRHAECQLKRS